MQIKDIKIGQVERTAHRLAKETMNWDEPIPDFNTRFPGILESCLITPFGKFGDQTLYEKEGF